MPERGRAPDVGLRDCRRRARLRRAPRRARRASPRRSRGAACAGRVRARSRRRRGQARRPDASRMLRAVGAHEKFEHRPIRKRSRSVASSAAWCGGVAAIDSIAPMWASVSRRGRSESARPSAFADPLEALVGRELAIAFVAGRLSLAVDCGHHAREVAERHVRARGHQRVQRAQRRVDLAPADRRRAAASPSAGPRACRRDRRRRRGSASGGERDSMRGTWRRSNSTR